ncbi:hypothetical protein [Pontibacter oryzae]|uniref:hypothetical protein n=1 Tax=Pontibacter oryzae TaxID=2304593 RepID=UPI00131522E8|nr:hypothetical protein [Pontibacter oryzae]
MKDREKNQPSAGKQNKAILREDDGKRTPPGPTGYANYATPHLHKPKTDNPPGQTKL